MTVPDPAFWAGRRVLVTGHSGFKGAWLNVWLQRLGARVTGLSRGAPAPASMHARARLAGGIEEVDADVRSFGAVREAVASSRPEVVFHLAAQPFVRRSLRDPRTTYEINVMGTVNVLEAVRGADGVRAVVAVTSDKAYDNRGTGRAFVEDDPKGGADPYSSSKGCAELAVDAYLRSYFRPGAPDAPRVGAARAGNVIGGGDRGEDRLVPDLVRAAQAGEPLHIRNPDAVRPWQHVLEPLSGYLALARALVDDPGAQGDGTSARRPAPRPPWRSWPTAWPHCGPARSRSCTSARPPAARRRASRWTPRRPASAWAGLRAGTSTRPSGRSWSGTPPRAAGRICAPSRWPRSSGMRGQSNAAVLDRGPIATPGQDGCRRAALWRRPGGPRGAADGRGCLGSSPHEPR